MQVSLTEKARKEVWDLYLKLLKPMEAGMLNEKGQFVSDEAKDHMLFTACVIHTIRTGGYDLEKDVEDIYIDSCIKHYLMGRSDSLGGRTCGRPLER